MNKNKKRDIMTCSLVLGVADTQEKTTKIAKCYHSCPYCTFFMSEKELAIGVFVIPANHKWWLEYVQKKPRETFGFSKAVVSFTDPMGITSPWSRGEAQSLAELAPSCANCRKCNSYKTRCEGCPATKHYIKEC